MSRKSKIKLFKIILAILVGIIIIGVTIYLFPVMKKLTTIEGQLEFEKRVNESGIIGMLMLFGLQVAQVFLIILPGEPIEILAGMCYGGIGGTIFITISVAIIIEFIAFNSVAIIMGRVAGIYAAAQNLICTMTTISFMVPFAISNAIAVKVGFANGAENYYDLKRYSFVGLVMSVGFMVCSAFIFANYPRFLTGLFTIDPNLIDICVPILYIVAIFQVFDGLQVALSGIFKGMKQTNIVLISNFTAYWVLFIPLGCYLAFHYNMKLKGFWIGLVIAAITLCSIMLAVLTKTLKNLKTPKCTIPS